MEVQYSWEEADRNQPSEINVDLEGIRESENRSLSLYGGENYYHVPAIKPSYYGWKIGMAFFSVGVGGISQILCTILDLAGDDQDRPLIRAGRYVALAGSVITGAIYIIDLHTPHRWYNMMRIFRKTSWMSIGSWCLAAFGGLSGVTAMGQLLEDAGLKKLGRWTARLFQIPAAAAGGILSLYSGAELEATSLPLWERSHPFLPALFAAENASSAASAMLLLTKNSELSDGMRNRLERFSFLAGAVEEILYRLVSIQWKKSAGDRSRSSGGKRTSTTVSAFQRTGMIASFIFRILRMSKRRTARKTSLVSPLLTLGSGFLLPVKVILSGNKSARHPEEYLSDTQGFASLNQSRAERATLKGRNTTDKGEQPMSSFVGLGLFLVGAAVILFFSRNRRE